MLFLTSTFTRSSVSASGEVPSEKAETPVIPGEKRELLRTPTLFELQGGDERVPVIAPAVIRKILPEKEY